MALLYHSRRRRVKCADVTDFVEKEEVMSISVEFRMRLLELVEESGEKKTVLAKAMGVDYRAFSAACNYGILPKPAALSGIADYFHISLAYLLGQTDSDAFFPAARPATFHERLRGLCEEKGITFYCLAKDCHFDKSCISKWYSLSQLPTFEILELIADRFDVSLDYLLGRSDDRD